MHDSWEERIRKKRTEVKICKRMKKDIWKIDSLYCIFAFWKQQGIYILVNVFIYHMKKKLCHNSGITVSLFWWPYILLPMIYIVHCFMLFSLMCYRPQCMEALPGILINYWSRKWYSLKPRMWECVFQLGFFFYIFFSVHLSSVFFFLSLD